MKKLLLIVLLFPSVVFGQKFVPILDNPVDFFQVTDLMAYVNGTWKAMDAQSKLSGVSVSEITCNKAEKVCHETQSTVYFKLGMVDIVPDYVEYSITRWNSHEIVAENIGGLCKVRSVLKFDRQAKKVFYLQSLSEPVDDTVPDMTKRICNAVGMNLELRARTTFTIQQK